MKQQWDRLAARFQAFGLRERAWISVMLVVVVLALAYTLTLEPPLKRSLAKVLTGLARAEARVHAGRWEQVIFHQLADVDMLISCAGFCAGLDYFRVRRLFLSPIPLGSKFQDHDGSWNFSQGPAAQLLLRRLPTIRRDDSFEWTTPTGAALLSAFGVAGSPAPFRVVRIGSAVGGLRPPAGRPKVLRLLLGELLDA